MVRRARVFRYRSMANGRFGRLDAFASKTPESCRRLDLGEPALMELRQLYDEQTGLEGVVGSSLRHQMAPPIRKSNFDRRVFHLVRIKADLPHFTFHDLRKASASLRLAAGDNIKVVQQYLGHKDPRLTMRLYLKASPRQMHEAAGTLDRLRRSQPPKNEGTFEGTSTILPHALDTEIKCKPLFYKASSALGRSRFRTCDPSRVKRVLYR